MNNLQQTKKNKYFTMYTTNYDVNTVTTNNIILFLVKISLVVVAVQVFSVLFIYGSINHTEYRG